MTDQPPRIAIPEPTSTDPEYNQRTTGSSPGSLCQQRPQPVALGHRRHPADDHRGDLPTWVKLSAADPLTGYANADCIEQLAKDELGQYLGALSPPSMRAVNQAFAIALALV